MADNFDPYREALVIETSTVWPEELADVPPDERRRIAERLHVDAKRVSQLEYVHLHAGFCRRITVTAEDVERVSNT